MKTLARISVLSSLAAAAVLLGGCVASQGVKNPSGVPVTEMKPDERGFVAGTGIESPEIVAVTDKMARSILSVPQIARAQTPPRIVIDPVKNDTASRSIRIFSPIAFAFSSTQRRPAECSSSHATGCRRSNASER